MSRKGEDTRRSKDESIVKPITPKEITKQIERLGICTWGDTLTPENTIAEAVTKNTVLGPLFLKNYVTHGV